MGSWVKRTYNESITRNITRTCEKPYYISILQGFDSPQVHEKKAVAKVDELSTGAAALFFCNKKFRGIS